MRAINHALAGAALGLTLPTVAALPLAVVSHYVLDAIPHYGNDTFGVNTKAFRNVLIIDAILCVALVVGLCTLTPGQWLVPALCAFLATAPDFMWVPMYLRIQRGGGRLKPSRPWTRFHTWIQWFERPAGVYVEVVWAGLMIGLLGYVI